MNPPEPTAHTEAPSAAQPRAAQRAPDRQTLGGRARPARTVLTLFSGADAFAVAAREIAERPGWRLVGGSEKKPDLVQLWESEAEDGAKIIGDFDTIMELLATDQLLIANGTLDAVVATPPCQDFTEVNSTAAGETGPTGQYLARIPEMLRSLRRRHHVKSFVLEEVTEAMQTKAFIELTTALQQTNHYVAFGTVHFYKVDVPTTRKRLGLVALHAPDMKRPGPFDLPGVVRHGEAQAGGDSPMPTLRQFLEPPEAIEPELREDADMLDMFDTETHVQSALPAVQLGRMKGKGTNRFVYSVDAPALTIRANTWRAEGLGGGMRGESEAGSKRSARDSKDPRNRVGAAARCAQ